MYKYSVTLILGLYLATTHVKSFQQVGMQTFKRQQNSQKLSKLGAFTSSTLYYKSKTDDDGAENTDINSKKQLVSDDKKTSSAVSGDGKNVKARVKRVISTTLVDHNYLSDIKSLHEWHTFLEKNQGKIVSVRFYSHVCKSCAAITPYYNRLAKRLHPRALFVDIPLTKDNLDLQKELKVTKVPFGHIYLPNGKLAEAMPLGKKVFSHFERSLYSYITGVCEIENFDYSDPNGEMEEDERITF
jgi:thiol-disulfide isomerase/thioredoxin